MKSKDPLPEGLVLNGYVYYYRNGWRLGILSEVKKGLARILPFLDATKHINIPIGDVKPMDQ
jgi:hypothetical protein